MDCFFAQVEMRENPALKGKPVAVGGRPGSRSVVAACSYEARKFGIHSAMPIDLAIKQCPHLVVLPVRMQLYKKVSLAIHRIFNIYTRLIEPLSLDEAFLDVSDCNKCNGSASLIAKKIRKEIFCTEKLTASAGVAPNKFLAKIASDWLKPDGLFVIKPDMVTEFVKHLPVNKIFGVGKVTASKMHKLGIETCLDLQQYSALELQNKFGKFGARLYELIRGIDQRAVTPYRIRKSLSAEDTFANDLPNIKSCEFAMLELYNRLQARYAELPEREDLAIVSLLVKVRFKDFLTTSAQTSGNTIDLKLFKYLLGKAWNRHKKPVRLIGLGVRFKVDYPVPQQRLF